MLASINPALDCPMILPQEIIEVRHRPVLAAGVQRSFTLELSDCGRVSRMPISVDDTRCQMVLPSQRFGQKALSEAASCLAERRKSSVAPAESRAR